MRPGGERQNESWQPFVTGLRRFVARRVPESDAEDVAQEVLLRLHQGIAGLQDASRAESWAYSIARRAIADFYRSRSNAAPVGEELDQLADGPAPVRGFGTYAGDHAVHEEVLSWLRPAAEALPEHDREALILADFDGLTQQEVADRLGLSISGAKSRIQRARMKLADELARCCEIAIDQSGLVVDFRRRERDCPECDE